MNLSKRDWVWVLVMLAAVSLQGCEKTSTELTNEPAHASQKLETPITIKHELGTTVINNRVQRVAVLDMNEADFWISSMFRLQEWSKTIFPTFFRSIKRMPQ